MLDVYKSKIEDVTYFALSVNQHKEVRGSSHYKPWFSNERRIKNTLTVEVKNFKKCSTNQIQFMEEKMKKFTTVIQMLALTLVFTVPVMAGTKVPKELCMTLNHGGPPAEYTMELTIKKGGKVKYSNIKSTFYSIQGTLTVPGFPSFPCDGSGYINQTTFPNPALAATLHCSSDDGPLLGSIGWSLVNPDARAVTLLVLTGQGLVYDAEEVDCKTVAQQ